MSIKSLLKPGTQNENWSKVYFNEINANSINGPASADFFTCESSSTGGPGLAVGLFPIYQEPDTTQTSATPDNENYVATSKGIRIENTGTYSVTLNINLQLNDVAGDNSASVLLQGNPIPLTPITQSNGTIAVNSNVFLSMGGVVQVVGGQVITPGISSTSVGQACQWKNWKLSITKLK